MLESAGSAVRESGMELQGSYLLWKGLKKYDRDRDWPVETVGITGLRENSGRDGGIEEPYWGPSNIYTVLARVDL